MYHRMLNSNAYRFSPKIAAPPRGHFIHLFFRFPEAVVIMVGIITILSLQTLSHNFVQLLLRMRSRIKLQVPCSSRSTSR